MKRAFLSGVFAFVLLAVSPAAEKSFSPVDYVNPFIGTTNFGTTNPGAVCPNGMMSVVPFNVMGSADNKYDKDARWWSTPYEYHNCFFTGYSHVNLSGVGCPELGSLLLMPTTGELSVDYKEYGSRYEDEQASPGYYTNFLTRYNVKTEVTATPRTGVARFTFPKGRSHILLNLGEGLTNETGAFLRQTGECEFEGMKLLGTFCYNPQAVFPIYFVMRVNKTPLKTGYWKKQRSMTGVEAEWDPDNGKYKLYTGYRKELAGDDIGAFLTFDTGESEQIEVQMGVSFVSIENARLNLDKEQSGKDFDKVLAESRKRWHDDLSRIIVEGGTDEQKIVFYTALYHALIHPNLLQDVNGQYPAMESNRILTAKGDRYTVFSLWDTYRNVHQLLTLVYPERQLQMVRSMLDMYREHGWLPKWELYGRETLTMEGDPSIPVIVDTWLKGLRGFDVELAYEAMRKGAVLPGAENLLRPDNDDYLSLGYVPLREQYDNSVSHALEYYIADNALSRMAEALAKDAEVKGQKEKARRYKEDARLFYNRSLGYKHYYSKEYGTFYTFYVPHDVKGLAQLMGGKKAFVDKLQRVFDEGLYDPANEPDIAYAHLFSYFKGEEWRTQKELHRLLQKYFKNAPDGIPGNDDTGTMSAWAIFNMMGFYPDCPGEPSYTLSTPVFDKVTIRLDAEVWGREQLVIETERPSDDSLYIREMELGGKRLSRFRISHQELVEGGKLRFVLR